jgi:4-hydroxy-tetrahydrodipicolinate synthase
MNAETRIRGVLAPVLTPFTADLRPDATRLAQLCRWLLAQDVGLALFGTTSEANSMSVSEKLALLDGLLDAGIPAARMMPGTGCCAIPDTVLLTRRAVETGCAGVLMLPPFYYKGVSDDGLFASYAEVIDRVGDARARIYLYHIPPVSQVPISLALIERLLARYPQTIAGVKDSSGDFDNMRAMMERFGSSGFDVFSGNESFLLAILRGGGAGCISATANVNAPAIAQLAREWSSANADAQQASLERVRAVFQRFPVIPALKAAVAHFARDDRWARLRPPLCSLTSAQRDECVAALRAIGFEMRGFNAALTESAEIVSS